MRNYSFKPTHIRASPPAVSTRSPYANRTFRVPRRYGIHSQLAVEPSRGTQRKSVPGFVLRNYQCTLPQRCTLSSLVEGQDCSHRCHDGAEEASAQSARIVAPVLRCRVLVHISVSMRTKQRQAMRTPQRTLSHSLQKNAAFAFSCFTAVSKSLQFMRSS